MKKYLLTILVLSANLLLSSCADDQARQQLADNNTKLSLLEKNIGQLNNKVSNQNNIDILNRIEDLQSQIEQLNGDVNTLKQQQRNYQLTQDQINNSLQSQLQSTAPNLNQNKNLEASSVSASDIKQKHKANNTKDILANKNKSIITEEINSTNTKSDDDNINIAMNELKNHNFMKSIKLFKELSKSDDDIISNKATYYLAVAYIGNKQYKNSIVSANKFIADNQDDTKVPDALRIIYVSQHNLGLKKEANKTLEALNTKYPNSEALKKIQQ